MTQKFNTIILQKAGNGVLVIRDNIDRIIYNLIAILVATAIMLFILRQQGISIDFDKWAIWVIIGVDALVIGTQVLRIIKNQKTEIDSSKGIIKRGKHKIIRIDEINAVEFHEYPYGDSSRKYSIHLRKGDKKISIEEELLEEEARELAQVLSKELQKEIIHNSTGD